MEYDAIIVGGGIAGLTAAAYLSKAGVSTLLCEKENICGGLVNSFERDGFVYDGGIRAFENSGVLIPMLKHLGIDMELVKNRISIGVEDRVIRINTVEDVGAYQDLLGILYPSSAGEIALIFSKIHEIMHHMDILYGIDNPLFLDIKKDRDYMVRAVLPWVFKYIFTLPKTAPFQVPVIDYLQNYTQNRALLDMITQHFFQKTPAIFALSYLRLYLDYYYPIGGTSQFVGKLVNIINAHSGEIRTNTMIASVDPEKCVVTDSKGNQYHYKRLVWAADLKTFYRCIDPVKISNMKVKKAVEERFAILQGKTGNDSVLTLFLGLDMDKEYFSSIASEHFFYTPVRTGLSTAGPVPLNGSKEDIKKWLESFFNLSTYEISIPALRDKKLAPPGKTGLIISTLFDYQLTRRIEEMGWYDEFKQVCEDNIINTLDASIYPGIKRSIVHKFSSTPVSMAMRTGNTDGALTGWSFLNNPVPAESRMSHILKSIRTPIPGVYQAGQWTYSPSGLPISLLTGKMAADRVEKEVK